MAVDSIIARPTNSVRVMVAEASGCCASDASADATDRPSLRAGAMHPTPVVRPAVTMEATAMMVMVSMGFPQVVAGFTVDGEGVRSRVRVAAAMYTAARMLKM